MNYSKRLQQRHYRTHLPISVNICNPVSHNFCLWTQCEAFCAPLLGSDRGARGHVRRHFVFSVDRQHEVLEEQRCQVVPSRQAPAVELGVQRGGQPLRQISCFAPPAVRLCTSDLQLLSKLDGFPLGRAPTPEDENELP